MSQQLAICVVLKGQKNRTFRIWNRIGISLWNISACKYLVGGRYSKMFYSLPHKSKSLKCWVKSRWDCFLQSCLYIQLYLNMFSKVQNKLFLWVSVSGRDQWSPSHNNTGEYSQHPTVFVKHLVFEIFNVMQTLKKILRASLQIMWHFR